MLNELACMYFLTWFQAFWNWKFCSLETILKTFQIDVLTFFKRSEICPRNQSKYDILLNSIPIRSSPFPSICDCFLFYRQIRYKCDNVFFSPNVTPQPYVCGEDRYVFLSIPLTSAVMTYPTRNYVGRYTFTYAFW